MNKKIVLALSVLMLAVMACSFAPIQPNRVVGSGNVTSETRNVSGFDSIQLDGSATVTVTIGSTESVVVEADDNIVPIIETLVQSGKLIIRNKALVNFTTKHDVKVTVVMKSINGISLNGSGNIDVSGVSGGNESVFLAGSGNITVTGTADSVDISLPGSGNIYCDGLQAKTATVKLAGSGNITVYASDSLNASILGSGNIRYSGNPAQVTKSVNGSGTINP